MAHVLFVCTGNYYRSRYAEIRTVHWALEHAPAWTVHSRGLQIDVEQKHNVGPLSPFAVQRLTERGIDPTPYLWMPQALERSDLEGADSVIVLDRTEHQPMLEAQFPRWTTRVTYWNVADGRPNPQRHPLAEVDEHLDAWLSAHTSG